jgi:hypothetical protein
MGHGEERLGTCRAYPALFWTVGADECLTSILQIDEELVKQQQAVYRVEGVDEDVCRISFPVILPVLILNAKLCASPAPR